MPPLRIGVVGLGFGAAVHVPALRAIPDVEVTAVCGRDGTRARAAADALRIPHAAASLEELFEYGVDAVTFALPPAENAAAVKLALANGLPVFCEKPLAIDGRAATELARRAADARLVTTVNFEFGEARVFRSLARELREGGLGPVRSVAIRWHTRSRALEHGAWSWKTDELRGGGVLPLLGSHVLHLVDSLLGPITEVAGEADTAATARFAPRGSVPAADTVSLRLVAGGVHTAISLCNSSPEEQDHCWAVTCERGSLTARNLSMDPIHGFQLIRNDATGAAVVDEDSGDGDGRIAPVRALARRFVCAIQAGGTAQPDFAAAARTQHLLDGAFEACRTGRTISFPDGAA